MEEQPASSRRSRSQVPPLIVTMLVKFIHVNCWDDLRSRCHPLVEAVTVDGSDFRRLRASLDDAIYRRTHFTHYNDEEEVEAMMYSLFYAIEWAGHEKVLSPDLETLTDADFRNQFRLIKERGAVDTLVVSYQFRTDLSARRLQSRHSAMVTNSLNMAADEFEYHRQSVQRPDPSGVGGSGGHTIVVNGVQLGTDDIPMEDALEDGNSANIQHDGHSGLHPSDAKLHVPPATHLTTPPSPATLVIYDGKREILTEINLKSPHKVKDLQDNSPSKPFGQAIRPMNNSSLRQCSPRSIDDAPALLYALNSVDNAEERSKSQKSIADKEVFSPTPQPSSVINPKPASVGSNNDGFSTTTNNYNRTRNMMARVSGGKQVVFNCRAGSDSTPHPLSRGASLQAH
ncbi:hypothetical protein O1611_g342 [Lasiodiplodia mahajangana]|uniref:Uncharacterized protein n=1 Tax=Lasiodiplodia mahajangana TaxID=1108764 RepID=A0ACC2K0U6_9PEZI|nr:hypothetical protein O1611_g342 [Lasiodiplodia mahajangana]